ncbi:hypothetical protein [uncultured Mediterranean phage]|nr:hypothetical protein [uncultured Mediterranean phage]
MKTKDATGETLKHAKNTSIKCIHCGHIGKPSVSLPQGYMAYLKFCPKCEKEMTLGRNQTILSKMLIF